MKLTTDEKLKASRREAKSAAVLYGIHAESVRERLDKATTLGEIERIMIHARNSYL